MGRLSLPRIVPTRQLGTQAAAVAGVAIGARHVPGAVTTPRSGLKSALTARPDALPPDSSP